MSLAFAYAKKKRRTSTNKAHEATSASLCVLQRNGVFQPCSGPIHEGMANPGWLNPSLGCLTSSWQMEKSNRGLWDVLCQCDEEIRGKMSRKLQGRAACQRDGIIKVKGWL